MTLPVYIYNDARLYQPATLKLKGPASYLPSSKCIHDLTRDGDWCSSSHATQSVSGDHMNGMQRPQTVFQQDAPCRNE